MELDTDMGVEGKEKRDEQACDRKSGPRQADPQFRLCCTVVIHKHNPSKTNTPHEIENTEQIRTN